MRGSEKFQRRRLWPPLTAFAGAGSNPLPMKEEWGEGARASRSLHDAHHALAAVLAGEEADQRARRVLEAVDHVLLDFELAGRHP